MIAHSAITACCSSFGKLGSERDRAEEQISGLYTHTATALGCLLAVMCHETHDPRSCNRCGWAPRGLVLSGTTLVATIPFKAVDVSTCLKQRHTITPKMHCGCIKATCRSFMSNIQRSNSRAHLGVHAARSQTVQPHPSGFQDVDTMRFCQAMTAIHFTPGLQPQLRLAEACKCLEPM
jgi:hypothetical protein